MKIYVLSDLHLELAANGGWVPPEVDCDVVVLAGDIHAHTRGIEWASQVFGRERGQRAIYVAGNHEFYGAEIGGLRKQLRAEALRSGIYLLDDDEVEIDGVRFVGGTLWTDWWLVGGAVRNQAMKAARTVLPDFSGAIRKSPTGYFLPEDSVKLHERSKAWIRQRLDEPFDGKCVVVSHHAPSFASVGARFARDPISAGFASDLTAVARDADLWVHGHCHNFSDYLTDGCRVVCNPRGYVYAGGYDRPARAEDTGFRPNFLVEI
jgi:predicted phosphodiesterase